MKRIKEVISVVLISVLMSTLDLSSSSDSQDQVWDLNDFLEYLVTQNSSLPNPEVSTTEFSQSVTADYENFGDDTFPDQHKIFPVISDDFPETSSQNNEEDFKTISPKQGNLRSGGMATVERVPRPKVIDDETPQGSIKIKEVPGSSYFVQTIGNTNITRLIIEPHNGTSAKRPWLRKRLPASSWQTTTHVPESTALSWPLPVANASIWKPLQTRDPPVSGVKAEKRVTGLASTPSETTVHWVKASNGYGVSKAKPTTTPAPEFNNLPIRTTPAHTIAPHQYYSTRSYKTSSTHVQPGTNYWTKDITVPITTLAPPLQTTNSEKDHWTKYDTVARTTWRTTTPPSKSTQFEDWTKYEAKTLPTTTPAPTLPATKPKTDHRSKYMTTSRPIVPPTPAPQQTTTSKMDYWIESEAIAASSSTKYVTSVPTSTRPMYAPDKTDYKDQTTTVTHASPFARKRTTSNTEVSKQKTVMGNDVADGGNLWWVPKPGYQFQNPANSDLDDSPYDYGDSQSPQTPSEDYYDYPDSTTTYKTLAPLAAKPNFPTRYPRPPQYFSTTTTTISPTARLPPRQKYHERPQTSIQVMEHDLYMENLQKPATPLNPLYNYYKKPPLTSTVKPLTTTPPTLVYLIDNKPARGPSFPPKPNANNDDRSYVIVNIWNYIGGQLTLMGQQKVPISMFQGMDLTDGDTMHVSDAPPEVLEMLTYKNPQLLSSLTQKPTPAAYYQSTHRPYTTNRPWLPTFWTPRPEAHTTRLYGGVGNHNYEGVIKVTNTDPNKNKPGQHSQNGHKKGAHFVPSNNNTSYKPSLPVVGFGSPHLEAVLPDFFLDAFPAASPSSIFSVPSSRAPTTTKRTPIAKATALPNLPNNSGNRNSGRNTLMALGLSMLPTVAMALPFFGRRKRSNTDDSLIEPKEDLGSILQQYSNFISLNNNHLSLNCSAIVPEEDKEAKALDDKREPDPKLSELGFLKKCLHFLAAYERQIHARMLNIVV